MQKARREDGAISLEMALSMPILVLVFVGVFAFSHAFYVRFVAMGRLHEAARVCAIRKLKGPDCQEYATKQLGSVQRFCVYWKLTARVGDLPGVDVEGVQVRLRCQYKVVGVALFDPNHRGIGNLSLRAFVPY